MFSVSTREDATGEWVHVEIITTFGESMVVRSLHIDFREEYVLRIDVGTLGRTTLLRCIGLVRQSPRNTVRVLFFAEILLAA